MVKLLFVKNKFIIKTEIDAIKKWSRINYYDV